MTRVLAFGSPYLLGFDHFERLAERLAKGGAEGYPPYNIEQTGDDSFRITLAVAGFAPADLAVTIEDNQLVIRGKQADDTAKAFLHRGIAARQFQRAFVLADGMEAKDAELGNGLLAITLTRKRPETRTKTIAIRTAGGQEA
ncbi:Small heat shock protein IbpB [Alphaproteobacteria bacterium SO-S41]|nr:Small heat shock protein IbpB [Alphaproteobacteria bacterium SO-S41]